MSRLIAAAALALVACGPSKKEQVNRLDTAVQRARDAPSSDPAKIRAAADGIDALQLDDKKVKTAAAVCSTAHHDRARMYELLAKLEADVKNPDNDTAPKLLAERWRAVDDLERTLKDELDRCSQHLANLAH